MQSSEDLAEIRIVNSRISGFGPTKGSSICAVCTVCVHFVIYVCARRGEPLTEAGFQSHAPLDSNRHLPLRRHARRREIAPAGLVCSGQAVERRSLATRREDMVRGRPPLGPVVLFGATGSEGGRARQPTVSHLSFAEGSEAAGESSAANAEVGPAISYQLSAHDSLHTTHDLLPNPKQLHPTLVPLLQACAQR